MTNSRQSTHKTISSYVVDLTVFYGVQLRARGIKQLLGSLKGLIMFLGALVQKLEHILLEVPIYEVR